MKPYTKDDGSVRLQRHRLISGLAIHGFRVTLLSGCQMNRYGDIISAVFSLLHVSRCSVQGEPPAPMSAKMTKTEFA